MIYQTLITARWKPHLLSWCMVMIALRHRLPWILTNALLSSLLFSSPRFGSLFLPLCICIYLLCCCLILSGFTSFSLWLHSLSFCVSSVSNSLLHALTPHLLSPSFSVFGYCFHFWAIPSMPLLIPHDIEKSVISCSVSFHLSVLFWNEKPWCCLGQYWNAARR